MLHSDEDEFSHTKRLTKSCPETTAVSLVLYNQYS